MHFGMGARLIGRSATGMRALVAAGLLSLFAFALALSASPQLHERLHESDLAGHHQCAATLLSSGSCEHSAAPANPVAVPHSPAKRIYLAQHRHQVIALLDFSLLEHAPPALS